MKMEIFHALLKLMKQNTFLCIWVFMKLLYLQNLIKNTICLFPERKDKTIADNLNPYFKPIQYHLGIIKYFRDRVELSVSIF